MDLLADLGDADDFLARLPELLEQMDERELVKHLATATLKARGLGNAQDETPGDGNA